MKKSLRWIKFVGLLICFTMLFGATSYAADSNDIILPPIELRMYNSPELEAQAKIPAYQGVVNFNGARAAAGMCRFCYGNASVFCIKNTYQYSSYWHLGTCYVNMMYSSAYAYCNVCHKADYQYTSDHHCKSSHTGCGLRIIDVCPFRAPDNY